MNTTALAMEPGESVLNELQDRSRGWHRDAAIALLLAVLAFAVRLNHVGFNSLSEAPAGARLATARPMSMTYYINSLGRDDIQVIPLYDAHYAPRVGDLIVLAPSRRFFETQRFFDTLGNSAMFRREVRVGPVSASTIYLFESSKPQTTGQEQWTITQLRKSPSELETKTNKPDFADTNTVVGLLRFPWRNK